MEDEKTDSLWQLRLSRVLHAIHRARSVVETLQAVGDGCQTLLPSFIGLGSYSSQDGWQWLRVTADFKRAIADQTLQVQLASSDLIDNLRQGGWGRLRLSPPLPRRKSERLSYRALDEIMLLPSDELGEAPSSLDIWLVPIQTENGLRGAVALSAGANSAQAYGGTPSELEVEQISAIVDHAALAVAQTKHREDLQQRSRELTNWVNHQTLHLQQALNFEAAIKRITEKIRDSLDERYIFETVIRELCETLVLDCCTVGFYNLDQQTVEVRYDHATVDSRCPPSGHADPMATNSPVYAALLNGDCVQFSTWTSDCRRLTAPQSTTLACPITDGQQVMGDLWLSRPKYSTFTDQERRLVQQVASQGAIGFRQARLYQHSQAQVKSLETLGDLKDNFLSTVSHELRTPITNIKMTVKMLELTLNQQTITDNRVFQYLEILQAETQREMTLINDLLDLQRLDAGRQPLELRTIEVKPWINQIVNGFKERAKINQQQLCVTVQAKASTIQTDEDCLKRIIAELINNACKYTPPHECISVDVYAEPQGLRLSVSNSGVVIPKAEESRVFEKFYRLPGSDRRKQGGTGLGLALIQQLARHLNGEISLSSKDNLTCFTLKLPLEPPDGAASDAKWG